VSNGNEVLTGLFASVREIVSDALPILVTLDGHANVTPLMARHASMLIGVETNPHYRCGRHGGHLSWPSNVTGKVRSIHEGDFVTSTPFNSGMQRRGATVVFVCDGVEIILSSSHAHNFEPNIFRSVGIEPTQRRILVANPSCSIALGWQALARPLSMSIRRA
jgi:microcystin degradation protein MlrC